jgi:hypothetical protein
MRLTSSRAIGNIVQQGITFNAQNWQGGEIMPPESLIHAAQTFFTLLETRQVAYVLVGGIAVLHYVEGRNTEDVNLLLAVNALRQLPEVTLSHQDNYFARGKFGELPLDFLLTENGLFAKVQKEYATAVTLFDRPITIATVEGLLLLKLYALPSLYRQGNFARVGIQENDVATLMFYYAPDMDKLLTELTPHVSPTDLTELQGIVVELSNRMKRFHRSS